MGECGLCLGTDGEHSDDCPVPDWGDDAAAFLETSVAGTLEFEPEAGDGECYLCMGVDGAHDSDCPAGDWF